ncbi:hypothetical protein CU100_08840 [Phyllobacterium endophyticum]|uniref:Uncharacterized protein n=1 Tax=Phyllobacterium endophyticum TaxID=1149773 RepID=A0A2P7AUC1_9HYPH|nr:hypothetical protein CU100_08840 [Phyllobacterium endophyticum]
MGLSIQVLRRRTRTRTPAIFMISKINIERASDVIRRSYLPLMKQMNQAPAFSGDIISASNLFDRLTPAKYNFPALLM